MDQGTLGDEIREKGRTGVFATGWGETELGKKWKGGRRGCKEHMYNQGMKERGDGREEYFQ